MLQHLCDLMAHQSWADAAFFHCWEGSPRTLEDEDVRRRTAHIAMVQEGFRKLIAGEPVSRPPEQPVPGFAELKERIRASGGALRTLLEGMTEERLARPLDVPWLQGKPTEITIAEALVQVAMHSQHHRGQNMSRLKQLGGTPQNVDWILWVWHGRPEGSWE
jgi:uncharacterized damage-inducible protein DinB